MKKTFILAAAAIAAMATPAMASDFVGPRAELTAGVDDVTRSIDRNDVVYGAAVGFDVRLLPRVTVGLEATADNVFERTRTIGGAARLGYEVVPDKVLVYARGGYSNYRDAFKNDLDGVHVGGGVEVNVVGPLFAGLQYEYHDFQQNVGRHAVKTRVGVRF